MIGTDHPGAGSAPRATRPPELDDLTDQLVAVADAGDIDRFGAFGYSLDGG
ncbi:hypothetical protein ACWDZ8_02150 [Streptomyces sp. NPDC003233]